MTRMNEYWPVELFARVRMEEVGAGLERVADVANMMGECHTAKNSSYADNNSTNKGTHVRFTDDILSWNWRFLSESACDETIKAE